MALQDTNNSQLSGVDVLRNLIKAPKAVGQVVQLQPQVEQPTTLSGVELLRSTIKPPEPPKEGFADLVYTEPVEPQVEKADFRPSVMWPAKPTTPSEIDIQEYDMTKGAPILSDQLKKDFMGTLQRFWRAAERPDEILAGTAEFVSALPGFAGGIAAAIGTVPLELGDRIIKDKSFTILDLYNASARSFEKVMGDWHEYVSGPIGQVIMGPRRAGEYLSKKVVEALGGKPTEPDQGYDPGLVGEVAMAPFTAVHEPLMKLSDHPSLDDMPNVKGLIKFTTDVAALIIGGRVYKGGKDKLIKDVEPLVERAKKLADLVDQIKELESQGADASMIQAAQKVAEIQRIQANLIADEIAANMDYGQVMKEDLSSKTKRIKKIRQPDKAILDVQVDKAMQKLPDKEEVKTVEKSELGKPVPDISVPEVKEPHKMTREEYDRSRVKQVDELYDFEVVEDGSIVIGERSDWAGAYDYYGKKVRRTKKALSGTATHEIRHLIDAKHGVANKIASLINKSKDISSRIRNYLNEFTDKIHHPDRSHIEYTETLLNEYFNQRDFLRSELPEIVELFDSLGLRKYAELNRSHREQVKQALAEGRLSIAEYNKLHAKDYGPVEKLVPVEATVYHGSGMSLRKGKFEEGTSFSPDRSVAEAYAKNRGDIEGNTPTLYESKISFSNPKIIRNEDKVDYDWFKKAKEEGHDGVVITEGDVPVEYVVINPKAVKEFKESSTKKKVPKKEPPSELDRQTGSSDILDRSTDDHPLRNTDPKETQAKHEMYKTVKIEPGNPEISVGKLVNDVNRWLDGDESVDITKVRGALSEMAARIGEVRDLYDNPNHFLSFRTTVDEAATWARKADRTKIKRSGELPSTQLNMMIPVDQVPKMVAQIFKDSKILMKDIFRNKELFDKTGFWYNKYDRKWVYEIDDSKVRVKPLSSEHLAYIQSGKSVKLIDVIDHPKLFEAMPKLKKTMVRVNEKGGNAYNSKSNLINVKSIDDLINPLDGSRSLLHEIGHAVREAVELKEVGSSLHLATANRVDEIFSELIVRAKTPEIAAGLDKLWKETEDYIFAGADLTSLPVYMSESIGKVLNVNSAKTFKPIKEYLDIKRVAEDYKANVGEVESRLVQKRANMTTEERRAKPPWEDMDEMMAKEGLNVKSEKKLYDIVGATIEGVKQLTELAKQLPEYTKAAKGMKKFKPKDAANMLREGFNRTFIDRAGNIRGDLLDKLGDEGYRIIQKMYGTAGASPWASNLMYQMNKEINAGLTGREKSIRDNLLLAMRIKDIAKYKTPKQFHYPDGLRPEVATAYTEMFGLLEKLSPEQIALIKQSANSYIEWMKKPLNDLLEEGLITKDEYDKLASHDYRRLRKVEDIYDRQHSTKVDKRKRSVYDSGVQHLSRGHKTDILEPDSSIMALEVFNRTYGRIFNNKANKTLLDLARRDPENSFAREKKKPVGWSTIYAYEEGVRKPIYISPDMAKEWVMRDSNISYKAAAILRYASMSPVLRTFATGVNWAFATANLPRDVMHAWYAARVFQDSKWDTVYSSHMPIFAAQMAWDLGATFSDALFRKGRYVDYAKEGGGMEFLVHQGRLVRKGRHIGGSFDAIENFLGYYGETTEIMTRLAIRDRVIRTRASEQGLTLEQARKNSKITEEATFAARDYMDFNQGGWATKAADNAIPYLSAATQATRGLFRSFKPGSGTALKNTYKLAQFAAAIAASYIAIQKLSPETHNALKGNSATQDNLCIPLGDRFGFEDEHGQMRYIYFKVPLDPGQKFFKTFFEACTDKWVGNEVDVDRVTSTLKKLSPVDITALPPSMSALIGYATNKDFWRNEDIWRKTDKPAGYQLPKVLTGAPIGGSEEEHTADTPALYTDVGKYTGLSPERTKYAVEEIITKDNMWADLLIGGYELTKDLPDSKRKQHLAELLVKLPVIKRFIGITNPSDRYRDTIDEVRNKYEFERFIQNEGLDSRTDRYLFDKDVERSEILEYMKSFKDLDTFNRLKERFVFQTKTKELPNFVFWRRLQGLAPEPRAKVFAKRWDETTPQQRSQMRKEIQTVINAGGVITDDFRSELTKIRLQGLKEVEVEN